MKRVSPDGICLAVAVCAAALVALAAVRQTTAAGQAWLAAYLFWTGLPVGAMFLVLVHGLTGGGWGQTLRPALYAMLRTTPLLALFAIPVLLAVHKIYPWGMVGRGWLDPSFFAARAVVYVVLWNAIALDVLRRAAPDGWLGPGFAWPALILLFGSTSLAAFDWVMSIEPRWTSTIFGLLVTVGWALSATAAALVLASKYVPPNHAAALDGPSRIMLALVFLWAYLSVIQLIVIWESDLSNEIPWYLRRIGGGWQWVALGFVVCEFVLPFLILAWRPMRQSRTAVLIAALSIMAAHLGEIWWLTVPDFGRAFNWADPLAVIAIGAAFLFVGGRGFSSCLPLPARPGNVRE